MERKSLNAVMIGPEAIAGSIPSLAKKNGEKTPRREPERHAPKSPTPTITPTRAGAAEHAAIPKKSRE